MRWDIAIPQRFDGAFDSAGVQSYLARAEELGFEGAWTIEQVVGAAPLVAPLELLAYCAALTRRIRLGVGVIVSSLHDPIQLASAVTAVDRLSDGRLDVGLGSGGGSRDFEAFGLERATFVARFVEGVQLMKAAWADESRVEFDGRFRHLHDVVIEPKPVQRPHPPLWFGGSAPKALARAVRLGNGFLGGGSTTTAAFADQVMAVRRHLTDHDRAAAEFPIGKRVYVCVDDDAERARRRVAAGLTRIYGDMPGVADVSVAGTPDDVIRGVREVIDAGADTIILNPLGEDVDDDREQMERLAADVLPALA